MACDLCRLRGAVRGPVLSPVLCCCHLEFLSLLNKDPCISLHAAAGPVGCLMGPCSRRGPPSPAPSPSLLPRVISTLEMGAYGFCEGVTHPHPSPERPWAPSRPTETPQRGGLSGGTRPKTSRCGLPSSRCCLVLWLLKCYMTF